MGDFSTPFGSGAQKRLPTATEETGGFACGPADMELFNGLFHLIFAEFKAITDAGGAAVSDSDYNALRDNIQAMIDAAVGSGDTSQFLLLSQASSRLPIYPEVSSADGKINVSSPAAGTVRIPGGVSFFHRGISPKTTTETDFPTNPSRIYHVRWRSASGFAMYDLQSAAYNPSSLSEDHVNFDTTYDDMLIARVVTNSSNVASITNLINKDRISMSGGEVGPNGDFSLFQSLTAAYYAEDITDGFERITVDMARKPNTALNYLNNLLQFAHNVPDDSGFSQDNYNLGVIAESRYRLKIWAQGDNNAAVGWRAWL